MSESTSQLITTPFDASSTAAQVADGLDLHGKRAVVTGSSSGISVETARALAAQGAEVTHAVRTPGRQPRRSQDRRSRRWCPRPWPGRVDWRLPAGLCRIGWPTREAHPWPEARPVEAAVGPKLTMPSPIRADGVSDHDLLDGFAIGDVKVGAAFVRRFQARVYGMALNLLGDRGLAEDVAQEAFVRAWRQAATYHLAVVSWLRQDEAT
jgi:hypothetical protein